MMKTTMNAIAAFLLASAISAASSGVSAREPGVTRLDADQSSEETGQFVSSESEIVADVHRVNAIQ
jgi:hypothetical protein